MTQTVPNSEPAALTAGDTAKWLKSLSDYPASAGWVLSYALVKAGSVITFSGTASGDEHLVTVPAATTASWSVGRYQYQASVTKAAERYGVGAGQIEIKPNFAAVAGGLDARSHARITLEAVEAVIQGRASQSQSEYTIANRQLKYIPLSELLALRDRYKAEVLSESRVDGLGFRNKILTRL